jgi:hypothetical protein
VVVAVLVVVDGKAAPVIVLDLEEVIVVGGGVAQYSPVHPCTHAHSQSPVEPVASPLFWQGDAPSGPVAQSAAVSQVTPL